MQSTLLAVDVAKNVFEIAVSRRPGKVSERHRLTRGKFLEFVGERRPAMVLLEAAGSAHHWGRQIRSLGHEVQLLPPAAVRRYRAGNKHDRSDAKALLEAARNEEIRRVPVKTVEQQALTSLHRLRSGWMATRIARINAIRGLLREFGVYFPVGTTQLIRRVVAQLGSAECTVPAGLRSTLLEACEEVRALEQRIRSVERQLATLTQPMPQVQHLRSIPGIGLLTASALVAFVGDVGRFPTARHFASYLGLTPREHSSGETRRLGRITKRGETYLRTLLTHGGRSLLRAAEIKAAPTRLDVWAVGLRARRPYNVAVSAIANKLARIAWAVWRQDRPFEARTGA